MDTFLLLLVSADSARMAHLRAVLAACDWSILGTPDVSVALSRIGGGGVGAVVLDLPGPLDLNGAGWKSLRRLHQKAPLLPVIVICDPGGHDPRTFNLGLTFYVAETDGEEALLATVREAIYPPATPAKPETPRTASIISVLGAKGGVGTTTVALNLAAVLAQNGTVILAEFRPMLGSLGYFFHPGRKVRRLADLLEANTARTVASCLWAAAKIPGLNVLFGPQTAQEYHEVDPEQIVVILESLARLADFVVIDLPPDLSSANRAIVAHSDYLALVVEREQICVDAAVSINAALEEWDITPGVSGTVLVNRAALVCPLPLEEIEAELAPILQVIPPAVDLCYQSQKARIPLIHLDVDSLVAQSFSALAGCFQKRVRPS